MKCQCMTLRVVRVGGTRYRMVVAGANGQIAMEFINACLWQQGRNEMSVYDFESDTGGYPFPSGRRANGQIAMEDEDACLWKCLLPAGL